MIRLIKYDFVGFLLASRIPNLLIIAICQTFTLYFLSVNESNLVSILLSKSFIGLILTTTAIAAAGYIINDYYDQKIDMINRPDKVVVGTLFRRRLALFSHFALTFGSIVIGFFINTKIGIMHFVSGFCLWYYSNSLRRLPLIGNLIIAFMAGMSLYIVVIYLDSYQPIIYVYSIFAMTIVLIREIIKDIEDMKGDANFGCQSVPVVWGIRRAKQLVYMILFLGAISLITFLIAINNWPLRIYFLCLLPIFGWFVWGLSVADKQVDFQNLVSITNLIILTGLISMVFIN